jgi:hypothetical protein
LPLYSPPAPNPALERAVGARAWPPEPRIRRESVLPDNLTLLRSGIRTESEISVARFESVRGTTTSGEFAISEVNEVASSGEARTRVLIVSDVGDAAPYIVGNVGDVSTNTAFQAVNPVAVESATPTGGQTESSLTSTPYEFGPTATDNELLNSALASYADQVAAAQYDSALGLGQPVYEAPTSSGSFSSPTTYYPPTAPTAPLQTPEDPYYDPYWSYLDPYTQPPSSDPYGELAGSLGF